MLGRSSRVRILRLPFPRRDADAGRAVVAYTVALFTVATYATEGLSLSQTKGSNVQALLAAGQMIGRPLCGILLDRYGRLNMASLLSVVAGMTCLVIWMFARSYGVLMFFAFVQGVFGGALASFFAFTIAIR